MQSPDKTYGLISSQKMVQYMWKYSLHKQATQIPCAVIFDEPLDFKTLAQAVNIEIERNDCLRLRIIKADGDLRQYFLPEYKLDRIPLRKYSTEAEMRRDLDADANRKLNVYGGETFRLIFFTAPDGRTGIYLIVSHMVMDAMATFTFFKDLLAVYDAMKAGEAMPKPLSRYEAVIQKELADPGWEEYVKKETAILADYIKMDKPPKYCSLKGTTLQREQHRTGSDPGPIEPKDFFPLLDKTHFSRFTLSAEDSRAITEFVTERQISAEWVIQMGMRMYLSKLNVRVDDTVFWVLCPRRRTVKEKRSGGTLASPMPWREILPGDLTFREGLLQLASSQNFLFRHADVPFTALRDNERTLFGYTVLQTCTSMMFSYLPLASDTFGGRGYEYMGFSMGHYVMPLYTVTLYDAKSGCYKFNYIHRIYTYSDEDIRRFHEGAVRTIMAGIRDPQRTIDEILEEI